MSITQFIVKLTSFIYCGSIYLFLGTYLDFFEKNYKPKFSDTYNILCLIGIMIFNLWFQNNHIYTVLFLCVVYYLFLHFTFQFKSKSLTIKMVTQQFEQCIRHQNYDTFLTL